MTFYTEEIYTAAAKYVGESEGLRNLCAAAEENLRAKLREGAKESEYKNAFIEAAALLAISMAANIESAACAEYSAGSVTVKPAVSASAAATLKERAEELMAPFTDGDGFAFAGVSG